MEGLELIAFQIISAVGTARSCYIEAIQEAKRGDYAAAEKLIGEGDAAFVEGHDAHAGLLQQEAKQRTQQRWRRPRRPGGRRPGDRFQIAQALHLDLREAAGLGEPLDQL